MTAEIRAIDRSSVHRIQSGQVIVDLCSVVKELVENSLDAGATTVDIRFKEHGLESIEVQDNGCGISKENYESIALKHYTSKLRSYEDLNSLSTFGFRGEALSSLCAVADLHVLTATASEAPRGTRLDFATSGSVSGTQVVAAQRGTTVVVGQVFEGLPVRRQELSKNIRREYGKVINLLQAYACVSTGIKLTASNVLGRKKTAVFATHGNQTVRENISNVFGQRAVAALTSLDLEFEMQSTAPRTAAATENRLVQIQGQVSKPIVGEGRQAPDRQMFFVNSRPCNLPQVAKAINEVYKTYNLNQSPFIFANIILDTNAYDVNVSPDKRQILLHEQGTLLDSLKDALSERFSSEQQTVPQTKSNSKIPAYPVHTLPKKPSSTYTITDSPDLHDRCETGERLNLPTEDNARAFTSPVAHRSPSQPQIHRETFSSPLGKSLMYEFVGQTQQSKTATRPRNLLQSSTGNGPYSAHAASTEADVEGLDPPISSEDFDLAEMAASERGPASSKYAESLGHRMQELRQEEAQEELSGRQRHSSLEAPIPSLNSSPVKPAPGVVPNAFERMRPMRVPKQTATITIGDTTEVKDLGTGRWDGFRAKEGRRTSTTKSKFSNARFSSALRAFAAPGSRLEEKEMEEKGSDLENDNEHFRPEWPRRGPNRPVRGGVPKQSTLREKELHALSDDDIEEDEDIVSVSEGIVIHRASITSEADEEADEEDKTESEQELSDGSSDGEYLDEEAKRVREDARVAKIIRDAEKKAARPTADHIRRAKSLLRSGNRDSTAHLVQQVNPPTMEIVHMSRNLAYAHSGLANSHARQNATAEKKAAATDQTAEERLTLSVSKADFGRMRVVGQFNLGFILAVRLASRTEVDELFIIDQHASDEKFNFERLSATTVFPAQRLVHPMPLDLSAVQREIVEQHEASLERNGFKLNLGEERNGNLDKGAEEGMASNQDNEMHLNDTLNNNVLVPQARLLSLPASRETTFAPADLEELIALLPEDPSARPSRVRRLLAMRACRSSIMVGRALTISQMEKVVGHLGTLDKPWNCPHGRPTMRHLFGLGSWRGWKEGDGRREKQKSDPEVMQGEDESLQAEKDDEKPNSEQPLDRKPLDWSKWLANVATDATEDGSDEDERNSAVS